MFDNICSIQLACDVTAQVLHPNKPIFAVGLVSGHIQTFRLPAAKRQTSNGSAISSSCSGEGAYPEAARTANHCNGRPTSRPRKSSLSSRRSSSGSPSLEGYGTVETIWQTRRHKGCCRSLAFSTDGSTLFSAGTDGIIKAASVETGRVVGKVVVPRLESNARNDGPSVLLALNASNLILGTDSGAVHIYELQRSKHLASLNESDEGSSQSSNIISSCLSLSEIPTKTYRPHRNADDPTFAEAIYSITALPPSKTSTSGARRSFVTTATETLAVCDLYKGVVACSTAQGEELISSLCCSHQPSSNNSKAAQDSAEEETILVGQSNGNITTWKRGIWDDRVSSVKVHESGIKSSLGLWDDDASVDCLAVSSRKVHKGGSDNTSAIQPPLVAAGLGNGLVKFMQLGTDKKLSDIIGGVVHDDTEIEGVLSVDFDLEGRLITAGGTTVKVWHPKAPGEQASLETQGPEADSPDVNSTVHPKTPNGQDGEALKAQLLEGYDEESGEERPQKRRKHKRRRKQEQDGRSHGILAFKGLE